MTLDRLTRNFGWYMMGEMAVRLSRLVTTIVLARVLMPADFGVAAIALTTYELIRVLSANGSSAMIVRASPDAFAATCIAINRLSYGVGVSLVALQVLAGGIIAHLTGRPDLFAMLAVLALAHMAVPLTEVCYARLQRDNRLKALAGIISGQVLLDNGLTCLLALAGFGAWAVVLPKLLTTPLYVALLWRASPAPIPRGVPAMPLRDFIPYSLPFLGSEILAALRLQMDKILVAAFLGIEALGVYAFAFNAGLGISVALTTAMAASLYPHFSEAHRNGVAMGPRFNSALRRMVLPLSLVILAQAGLAIYYVPIVFGAHWAFAAPYVAVLCLSGLLRPLYDATTQMLRAVGDTRAELVGATAFTATLLAAFALALRIDMPTALAVFAAVSVAGHGLFALWARRRLRPSPTAHPAPYPLPA